MKWKFEDISSSKYSNKRITVDGITFDSKLEFECYNWLVMRFKECEVLIHPKYEIVVNKKHICNVIPDFEVIASNKSNIFVDAKAKNDATLTDVARIKYKLFEAMYNRRIFLWPKEAEEILGWEKYDGKS